VCGKPLELKQGKYGVHHKDYTSDEPENLITLCASCHRKQHGRLGLPPTKPMQVEADIYWKLVTLKHTKQMKERRRVTMSEVIGDLLK
jgi:5-methylcytosine-specific restriction endonuclease McrA